MKQYKNNINDYTDTNDTVYCLSRKHYTNNVNDYNDSNDTVQCLSINSYNNNINKTDYTDNDDTVQCLNMRWFMFTQENRKETLIQFIRQKI